jgi:catechol 2,3-dioxygenase-like lactoylglutathione lyase family enzyme
MRAPLVAMVAVAVLAACRGADRAAPLGETARGATAHGEDLSHPIPIFSVRDLRASQRYYRDALGFRLLWEDGAPPDFGAVGRGETTLFLCQQCQGQPGAWAMVFTPDVDRLYAELTRRQAIIKRPPADMPWHLREMQIADPDGNVLRVGSPMKH